MDMQGLLNTALSITIVFTFIFIVPNSATLSKSDKKDKKARSNKSGSGKTLKEKWLGPIDRSVYERGKLQGFYRGIYIIIYIKLPIV